MPNIFSIHQVKQEREKLSENNFLKDIPGDQVEEIFKAKKKYI